MKLKRILALENEVNKQLDAYKKDIKVSLFSSAEKLTEGLDDEKESSLLIAATDSTIALGKALGIATLAYANSNFPNQTYSGVDMVVEGFDEVDADFLEKVWQRQHHIPWTILETERCIVREISLDDLDALFELYEDEEITKFTEGLYPYEEEKEFQRAYINNMYRFFGYGMWLVFNKETGTLIGRAGLEHREIHEQTELELGYIIGTKYQGRGYATEVCKAILEYAKENTSFEQINCVVQKENAVSIHLAEKLGFVHTESFDFDGKIMFRFIKDLDV